jgi:hypothetical protein
MIHLKHTLWLQRFGSTINKQHASAYYHKRFCSEYNKKEIKQANLVETEGNIVHATRLLGEAVQDDQEKAGHGGNTTIHHQHVIYKNKESHVCSSTTQTRYHHYFG